MRVEAPYFSALAPESIVDEVCVEAVAEGHAGD